MENMNPKFVKVDKIGFFKPKHFNEEIQISEDDLNKLLLSSAQTNSDSAKTSETVKQNQKFEASEHKYIGNDAFKKFLASNYRKELENLFFHLMEYDFVKDKNKLYLRKGFYLEPGEIVALAGDFYAVPDKPISFGKTEGEKITNFELAYTKLETADLEEVKKLLAVVEKEKNIFRDAIEKGNKPNIAFHKESNNLNKAYGAITQHTIFPGTFLHSRYIDIAKMNYDHFGNRAKNAFGVGYEQALGLAAQAHTMKDEQKKLETFINALTRLLFACHFLTDLFAAGHVRTLRKEILEHISTNNFGNNIFTPLKSAISGLLVKHMHDEDGMLGLEIKSNKYPEGWRCYGDGCYFEVEDETNRNRVVEIVQVVLTKIYDVYKKGLEKSNQEDKNHDLDYTHYLPRIDDSKKNNHPAMFVYDEKTHKVGARVRITDINCTEYTYDWDPKTLLSSLYSRPSLEGENPFLTDDERKQLMAEFDDLFAQQNDDEKVNFSCGMQ